MGPRLPPDMRYPPKTDKDVTMNPMAINTVLALIVFIING
jgi:hypothetical protein